MTSRGEYVEAPSIGNFGDEFLPVSVVVRVRPPSSAESVRCEVDGKTLEVYRNRGGRELNSPVGNNVDSFRFCFDGVIDENVSQSKLFERQVAKAVVGRAMDGYNGTVLAYGQTGAGKTYTMMGDGTFVNRGIVPRAISQIFRQITSSIANPGAPKYRILISFCEIYNETLLDLLSTLTAEDQPTLTLSEDESGCVVVRGLGKHVVEDEGQALELLFGGEKNRAVAEHRMNASSSRSHTVFTIHIERIIGTDGMQFISVSKLNLVDLAGSERLSKTGSIGSIQREAQYINRSLSFLEQVTIALGNRGREHIPYRSSKLTYMLKDSIGGNCRTLLIANIWGDPRHTDETIATAKFAARMMRVSNTSTFNSRQDSDAVIHKLEQQVRSLKLELTMQQAFGMTRDRATADPFEVSDPVLNGHTDVELKSMREKLVQFLNHDLSEPPVVSSSALAREYFFLFRALHESSKGCSCQRDSDLIENKTPEGTQSLDVAQSTINISKGLDRIFTGVEGTLSTSSEVVESEPNEAFSIFKTRTDIGRSLNEKYVETKSHLKQVRATAREKGNILNSCKAEIDRCAPGNNHNDLNEAARISDIKCHYRAVWEEFNAAKGKLRSLEDATERSRKALIKSFYEWFSSRMSALEASPEFRPHQTAPVAALEEVDSTFSSIFFSAKANVSSHVNGTEPTSLAEQKHFARGKMIAFGSKLLKR